MNKDEEALAKQSEAWKAFEKMVRSNMDREEDDDLRRDRARKQFRDHIEREKGRGKPERRGEPR